MEDRGYDLQDSNHYYMSSAYNIPVKQAMCLLEEFCTSDAACNLKAYADAAVWLPRLAEKGWMITAITSFSTDPYLQRGRRNNLIREFGDIFTDVICTGFTGGKESYLKEWKNQRLWWIEDKASNAREGLNVGLKPILLNRPWNKEEPNIPYVNNWYEIYSMIIKDNEEYVRNKLKGNPYELREK